MLAVCCTLRPGFRVRNVVNCTEPCCAISAKWLTWLFVNDSCTMIDSRISLVWRWPSCYLKSGKGGEKIWQGLCVWHNRLRRMMFRFEYDTLFLFPLSEHVSPGCKDSTTPVNPAVGCSQPRALADSSVSNRWCPVFVIKETSSRTIRCISDKSLFFLPLRHIPGKVWQSTNALLICIRPLQSLKPNWTRRRQG